MKKKTTWLTGMLALCGMLGGSVLTWADPSGDPSLETGLGKVKKDSCRMSSSKESARKRSGVGSEKKESGQSDAQSAEGTPAAAPKQ